MYNVTETHFRTMDGALIFVEPLLEEHRLYRREGETFLKLFPDGSEVMFKIERMAIADNIQHVNVSVVEEEVKETEEPHF